MTARRAVALSHTPHDDPADIAAHDRARHAHKHSVLLDACGHADGRRYTPQHLAYRLLP